jgi:hypothetical protein
MNKFYLLDLYKRYALSLWLFLLWFAFIFILGRFELWRHIGVSHMKPLFADLHAVLSAIECHSRGLNVYATNPCDVASRVHVYGSLWLELGALGLGAAHLFSKGFIVNIVFMAIAVWLIKPSSRREFLVSALILLSPAVTLGVERANNDLIVFSLLAGAAVLFTKPQQTAQVSGLFVIYLSALLKFYPSVLFAAAVIIAKRNKKNFLITAAIASGLFITWLATNYAELLLVKTIVPKPLDFYATGARALLAYVGRPYPWILTVPGTWLWIGFIILIATNSIILAYSLKLSTTPRTRSTLNYVLFIFGLLILFSTYAINSNYDYRWIFFIFTMPLLFEIQRTAVNEKLPRRLVICAFIFAMLTMWTEALRATGLFGLININVFFNIGRSTFSIELLQQFMKELSAWGLFSILFAFAMTEFPRKGSALD